MNGLEKRRMLAVIAKPFAPSYGSCLRCGMPWRFAEEHVTDYTKWAGCFPLCEPCWSELTPAERLPFYEQLLDRWERSKPVPVYEREAIRAAVIAGA